MRTFLICAAALLFSIPAEAQQATYTDHWVDEQ